MWLINRNLTVLTLQIWDFNSGCSRTTEEFSQLEVTYGGSDAVFMIKNFGELMKETSFASTVMFANMFQNGPKGHENKASSNVSHDCISV